MSLGADRATLRELAQRVAEVAALPVQLERARMWTTCNDLRPVRPMVFADPQGGWDELDAAWIELRCTDPVHRGFEHVLRRRLLRHAHIPDDYPILNTFAVPIPVCGAGYQDYGLELGVERSGEHRGAYRIAPAIRDGKRVLIASHGNSQRALAKYLDNISDEAIAGLNIPTGVPLVYELDDELRPVRHYYLGRALPRRTRLRP